MNTLPTHKFETKPIKPVRWLRWRWLLSWVFVVTVVGLLATAGAAPAQADQQGCGDSYRVTYGDSLRSIARRCGTTVSAILAANPEITNPNLIYVNQLLRLPTSSQPPNTTRSYIVQPGDTLARIAARFNTSIATIRRLNPHIRNPHLIYAGQRLTLPAGHQDGPPPSFTEVDIFLVAPGDGQIGCGDRLVPVQRQISPTQAPLRAALSELLGLDEQWYGQSGLYNALSASELQIDRLELQGGQASIYLTGQLQLGGVCDTPRLEAQLRQTALQFDTVNSVQIWINGRSLEEVARTN